VQVFYDTNRDGELKENGLKVIEADLIREQVVVESGVKMTVIRHDPEKLARALIKALSDHPKLHESV
jgi:hypothetical protein